MRVLLSAFGIVVAFGVAGCQPSPPPSNPKAETVRQDDGRRADLERFMPAGAPDSDDVALGPMTLETAATTAAGPGADQRFRFGWMNGQHEVIAVVAGVADGKAVIDRLSDGKPLTLAAALGAANADPIALLAVELENGPDGRADYTPLCGVRPVTHIAMLRKGDSLTLATSVGAFGAAGANGCSNTIAYAKAP